MSTPASLAPDPARRARAERDLREFLRAAEEIGELVVIEDADPHLEMGALYEISQEHDYPPVLLFDRIKGYPPGYRIVTNVRSSRTLSLGDGLAAVIAYRKRRKDGPSSIEPEEVATGPVFENVLTGDRVNVLAFPAPRWHELDGGRYIGTECLVITADPDSRWVNLGTYRAQVQDEKTISVFIEPGKHGSVIRKKYWDRGEPCPMVLCVGQAPVLSSVAGTASHPGESELATAGGRIGEPISVVRGRVTDLPFPADAELVFEGYMHPPSVEARPEGPFGEWPGYYASDARPEPVLRVEAIYHRNNPIITCNPPAKPTLPGRHGGATTIRSSAAIWDALEAADVPGVRGVWRLLGGGSRFITVVAIKQQHAGHARMAGLVATGCGPAAYLGRLTVVVEDDIDITNPVDVLWAISTRWDPKTQTDIIDSCWTGHIDPLLSPAKRDIGDITNSRAIIYAVRPYHWRDQFPKVNRFDPAKLEEFRAKWSPHLDFVRKRPG